MATNQTTVSQVDGNTSPEVGRRDRLLALFTGTLQSAVVFGSLLLAAMALDWSWTPFETPPRVAMTVGVLLTGIAIWIVFALRPAITGEAESSASPTAGANSGDTGVESPHRVLVHPWRTSLRNLFAVVGLFAIACLLDRGQVAVLWQRFWSPAQTISLTTVTSPTADRIVLRNHPVSIVGRLHNRLRDEATIWLRDYAGTVTEHPMNRDPAEPGKFAFHIKDVSNPIHFRIRAGDGQTPWHQLDVVDLPKLTNAEYKITPPAYSGLPTVTQAGLPKQVRALAGSTLEVTVFCNEPLRAFALQFADGAEVSLPPDNECIASYRQELTEDVAFVPHLINKFDLSNEQPPTCRIAVYQDEPPRVSLDTPGADALDGSADSMTVAFVAQDDFGVAKAELQLIDADHLAEKPLKVIKIPLGEQQDQTEVKISMPLDLTQFTPTQRASLTGIVRVFDTNGAAGQDQQRLASSPDAE